MIAKIAMFFRAGKGYALAVEQIDQIVAAPRLFPLPFLPPGFGGVFLHKGEAVPLLRLQTVIGLDGSAAQSPPDFVVILHSEAGRLGLPADEVLSIVGRRQGASESSEEGGGRIFVYEDRQYAFLDTESLLATLLDTTDPEAAAEGLKED